MPLHETIAHVADGYHLTRDQAAEAMTEIMRGNASGAQIGGLLVALRMKGETADEITGFAETMREFATKVETGRKPLVDTCGTGGDVSGTFNISTTAAFVVAGAGIAVAKHGNRSASSRCGSADVLEALNVNIEASPERVGRCIDELGIGFLYARQLHTAMKYVAQARMELKLRTVFNILGPLSNPANATGQVIGVFNGALIETMAEVLMNMGMRHGMVVAGLDGLDEVSSCAPTRVAEFKNGSMKTYEVAPQEFGFELATRDTLQGGDPADNARILREVLEGKPGPHREIVLLNAAPAIVVGEGAADWKEGVGIAAQAIDSGAALEKLEALVRFSHDS